MADWLTLERDGVQLACLDVGGAGSPPALLLHGLAGHAGEWRETAGWLTERCRVVALDARGHGRSERAPEDVSREAHVADVAFAIEQLGHGPVVLIGQSLGGHLALLVAARRPDLVRGLVLADASPAGPMGERGVRHVGDSLARWPVPFATRDAAVAFFGGPSLMAEAWADGLERRDGGWWPCFDVEVMVRTLREATARDYWDEWGRVRCPALVVRAGAGTIAPADAQAMVERLPGTRLVELPGAAHDLHLDRPAEWRDAVLAFLATLDRSK
ncbi:MAG TPA: alpha/beta hydrolase [Conexibacter sp.]|jgi:pimeloyl-ACP methyl ester carboxylesterase|nr:alpha/beta hydrolase [Conexibacter sp.]